MSHKIHLEEHTKLTQHLLPLADPRAAGTFNSATAQDQLTSGQPQYEDAMLVIDVGLPSGTPDAWQLIVKLQEGATSTPATDVTGKTVTLTGTATTGNGVFSIPFSPAKLLRYYDVNAVLSFTNGSTPKLPFSVIEVRTGGNDTMAPV